MPADASAHGVLATDGVRVQCHECGRWLKRVGGRHLRDAHEMTAEEYRRRHGLAVSDPLMAPETRQRYSAAGTTRAQRDPAIRAMLDRGAATAATRSGAASRAAAASRADWVGREGRRRRVRELQPLSTTAAAERTRQTMGGAARARGYEDLDAYLRATPALTDRQVAAELGVGRSTVSRERLRVLGRRTGRGLPLDLPDQAVAEVVAAVEQGITQREVAARYGIARGTVGRILRDAG